jgi:transcriptional regulator with XRE-family HTH domain
MKQFSKDFKEARIKAGISQRLLAQKSGIVQCTISRYENGKQSITFNTAMKIVKILKDNALLESIINAVKKEIA